MFKFIGLDNPINYLSRNTQQLLDSTVQTILFKTGFQSDYDSDYTSDKSQQQQSSSTNAKLNNNPLSYRRQLPTPNSSGGVATGQSITTRKLPPVSGIDGNNRASSNMYYQSSSPLSEMGANVANNLYARYIFGINSFLS